MNNGTHIKNGVMYSGGANEADQIAYDNTASGLEATNTQEAIDEINSDLTEKDIQITWQNFPGSPLNERCRRDANNGMISTGRYNAITGITPSTMIKLGTVTKSEDRPNCYVTAPLFEQDANSTSMTYCGVVRLGPTGEIYAYFTKKPTWTVLFTLKWMY